MDSYKRFSDDDYKHWLQTAESLYILRKDIQQFVETETETYHRSLQEKLKDQTCTSKCSLYKCQPKAKKFDICAKCEQWKYAIINNHNNNKMDIPWNNCQSHLWPTNKWEVAKVYMIKGNKNHHSYDEFDITAILNFMLNCKHFKAFTGGQCLTKVISVRNKVMHSPDFRLSKKEMDDSITNVKQLAEVLEKHVPGLKTISERIQQFRSNLEKCSGQDSADGKDKGWKLLDMEQHALREKLEFLSQCYEEDQGTELKLQEELQGMRDFLDQNKDLLENLGPQVQRFNEIQEKVNKHDQDINILSDRVERLETVVPDPQFSGDALRFKNHVFEEARRRNMPEPKFTEECEANGYRGIVNVHGQTFTGLQVCLNIKTAHQEVAKIALEYMKSHPEWKEEAVKTTSSGPSSTSGPFHYGIVTVVLKNQEVVSDACAQKEEAIESAYRKLACQFKLPSLIEGSTFRAAVLEHFQRCNFPLPVELSLVQDDKSLCKLQLSGNFTFHDTDGSSKKKQAEQQAAKVALEHLSGLLNWTFEPDACSNYKGFLKEHLEAEGLKQPEYREGATDELEPSTWSEDSSQVSTTKEISKNSSCQAKNSVTVLQDLPTANIFHTDGIQDTETLTSSLSETTSKTASMDSTGTMYYGVVTVVLNQEVVSDCCAQDEEATESAYRKLACLFGLTSLEGKTAILEHFQRCNFPAPRELSVREGDTFVCKLQLTGAFTFSDEVGSSKRKQAEQQAAKVALERLSGLLNWRFEPDVGSNYKGFLKERLEANRLKQPDYSCTTTREGATEELGPHTRSEDSSQVSTTKEISKNSSCQAKNSVTVLHLPTANIFHTDGIQDTETLTSSLSETTSKTASMDSTGTMYYGVVTVVLNQEVVSDCCAQDEEATESAYRKLACLFGLTSLEGKTAILEHFQRCNFPAPRELSVREGDTFVCKLQLTGAFTFSDEVGSSKRKQAEQQAAKVALERLSGLLNWRFEPDVGSNYKGFLKERLEANRLKQPDYSCTTTREGATEELGPHTRSEDSSQVSTTKEISKNSSCQAKNSVTVLHLPTANIFHTDGIQDTETLTSSLSETTSKTASMDSTGTMYYGVVTVVLNQEVVSDCCAQDEEATESAYRKLACLFGLTSLEGKTAILEHFQRCNFPAPRELSVREGDTFVCKLQLTGAFTFSDEVGSSKRKQSEQQAAKVALERLSGLLNWRFEPDVGSNYKGFLKERLEANRLKQPDYSCTTTREGATEELGPHTRSEDSSQGISKRRLEAKELEHQDASFLDKPSKSARLDCTAINALLALFHLKPPSVTVEPPSSQMVFSCRMDVNLNKFTFENQEGNTVKKDSIRKTYLLLGNALGISGTKLDENNASMLVKQHFSQKLLPHPKEAFLDNKCFINDITYTMVYEGKGSTEEEAKLVALQKALEPLAVLFGYKSLPKCSTAEETEVQINTLLRTKGQNEIVYSHNCTLYKSSVELVFNDYSMESKEKKREKENFNHLSGRILGLLGVEPEPNTISLRNCLGDWFKQRNLKQPVFEDTEEINGAKATFSVKVSCSNPNWEVSMKVAEEKLVSELQKRLKSLTN